MLNNPQAHTCFPGVDPRALAVIDAVCEWQDVDELHGLAQIREIAGLPDTLAMTCIAERVAVDIAADVTLWSDWHHGSDTTGLTEPQASDHLATAERTALRFLDAHTAVSA